MFSTTGLCLLLALGPFVALAQDDTTPSTMLTCSDSSSMAFEPANLTGYWYEVARYPAPASAILCTQVELTLNDNNVLDIATTWGDAPAFPWVNATWTANISLGDTADNPYGYNFSYHLGYRNLPTTTFKLLATNYTDYALICGYQNFTDNSTFFNILLTRDRMPDGETLNKYENLSGQAYYNFSNATMTKITQDIGCYTYEGAASLAPFGFGLLLAFILCLNNFF